MIWSHTSKLSTSTPIIHSIHPSIRDYILLPRLTVPFCTGAYPNTERIKKRTMSEMHVCSPWCSLRYVPEYLTPARLIRAVSWIRHQVISLCRVCVFSAVVVFFFFLSVPFQHSSLLTLLWLPPVAASQAAANYPLPPTAPELLCFQSS